MKSLQDNYVDRLIRRGVELERYSESMRRDVLTILNSVETEVVKQIAGIDPTGPKLTKWKTDRLTRLNKQVKNILDDGYSKAARRSKEGLLQLAGQEGRFVQETINGVLGVDIVDVALTTRDMESLVSNTMIDGRLIGDWWDKQDENFRGKFEQAMNDAMVQVQMGTIRGEGVGELIKRVRGGTDLPGMMKNVKRESEALVRTSVMSVANDSRWKMYKQNEDLIRGYQVVATLDSATTITCASLDGREYTKDYRPVGHSLQLPPGPPFHWNCRSTIVPVFKSYKEMKGPKSKLSKKRLKKLDGVDSSIRPSMTGKVSAKTDYDTWLKAQPEEIQIDMLGKRRQKIWVDNDLSMQDMVNQRARPLTIKQLEDRFQVSEDILDELDIYAPGEKSAKLQMYEKWIDSGKTISPDELFEWAQGKGFSIQKPKLKRYIKMWGEGKLLPKGVKPTTVKPPVVKPKPVKKTVKPKPDFWYDKIHNVDKRRMVSIMDVDVPNVADDAMERFANKMIVFYDKYKESVPGSKTGRLRTVWEVEKTVYRSKKKAIEALRNVAIREGVDVEKLRVVVKPVKKVPVKKVPVKPTTIEEAVDRWKDAQQKIGGNDYYYLTLDERGVLDKAVRDSYMDYVAFMDDTQYAKARSDILEDIFQHTGKGYDDKFREIVKGTEYIPFDVLYDLKKGGVRLTWTNKHKSFYRVREKRIFISKEANHGVVAHEFGHAIDHYYCGFRTKIGLDSDRIGFLSWDGVKYGTKVEGQKIFNIFDSLHKYEVAFKGKGKNRWKHYVDNAIEDYDLRIYDWAGGKDGVEFWTNNLERYNTYLHKIRHFDQYVEYLDEEVARYTRMVKNAEDTYKEFLKTGETPRWYSSVEGFKTNMARLDVSLDKAKLRRKSPTFFAEDTTAWLKVKEFYPEMADFIEDHYNQSKRFMDSTFELKDIVKVKTKGVLPKIDPVPVVKIKVPKVKLAPNVDVKKAWQGFDEVATTKKEKVYSLYYKAKYVDGNTDYLKLASKQAGETIDKMTATTANRWIRKWEDGLYPLPKKAKKWNILPGGVEDIMDAFDIEDAPRVVKSKLTVKKPKNIEEAFDIYRDTGKREDYFNYVAFMDDVEYKKVKDDLIKSFVPTDVTQETLNNIVSGLQHYQFDLLYDMRKAHVQIKPVSGRIRGDYRHVDKSCILDPFSEPGLFAHEFAHAVDDFFGGYKTHRFGFNTWGKSKKGTQKQGQLLKKLFNKQHGNVLVDFTNDDGQYFVGNWMDNYDARMYTLDRPGVEWWSMNNQRYHEFVEQYNKCVARNLDVDLNKTVDLHKKNIQSVNKRYMDGVITKQQYDKEIFHIKKGSDGFGGYGNTKLDPLKYAMENSEWGEVKEFYPELADFIEEMFPLNKRFMDEAFELGKIKKVATKKVTLPKVKPKPVVKIPVPKVKLKPNVDVKKAWEDFNKQIVTKKEKVYSLYYKSKYVDGNTNYLKLASKQAGDTIDKMTATTANRWIRKWEDGLYPLPKKAKKFKILPDGVEDMMDEIMELGDAPRLPSVVYDGMPRKELFKAVENMDVVEYEKIREQTITKIVTGNVTKAQTNKITSGLKHLPFDILHDLEQHGTKIKVVAKKARAYYDEVTNVMVISRSSRVEAVGHEIAHAIDNMCTKSGKGKKAKMGFSNWKDVKASKVLMKEYNSRITGEVIKTKDGYYHVDNWLDDYEGRIYKYMKENKDEGLEWWAMNNERYNVYVQQLDIYMEDLVENRVLLSEVEGRIKQIKGKSTLTSMDKKRLKSLAREREELVIEIDTFNVEKYKTMAMEDTEWMKVREFYPELAKYIEDLYGVDKRLTTLKTVKPVKKKPVKKKPKKVTSKKKALSKKGPVDDDDFLDFKFESVHKQPMSPSRVLAKDINNVDNSNNYVRFGAGREWYLKGKLVTGAPIDKLDALKIPPAWTDVVVAVDPAKKVQAIGKDVVGRMQYRYSAKHIEEAAAKKFHRQKLFANDMPSIEDAIKQGMKENDPRAFLLQLENKTGIRAGSNKDFKAKIKAYGLTTLQHEHVTIEGNKITLKFVAKKGVPVEYTVKDNFLSTWLSGRKDMTKVGDKLFPDIPATKLNSYIKEITGGKKYTIKDFRTYHATRIAYTELKQYAGEVLKPTTKKKIIKDVLDKVSGFLHNTPTMARQSYIDPFVWELIGGM